MLAHSNLNAHSPGPWLHLTRWVIIVYSVFTFAAVVTGTALFPAYAAQHPSSFRPTAFWTYEQTQAGLAQLGWPPMTVAWVRLASGLSFTLGIGAVVLLILWRKSHDWFGLYLSFAFLSVCLTSGSILLPLVEVIPALEILGKLLGSAGWQFFFIVFYFFPNGRPMPGWTRWLALAWAGFIVLNWIYPPGLGGMPFGIPLAFGFVLSALGSQIFRYFWRSDPIQRQQTKWVMLAIVFILATLPLGTTRAFDPPTGPDFGTALFTSLVNSFIRNAVFLLLPIAIVIAILRYRLWDIDILIRRTLQYSLLSGLLALTYFGLIVVLQSVFTAATGQQSPVALVLSTLAIAALFFPMRKRVQDFIDRRFFRQKYDATKTLADFAATARDETDLDKLTARLVEVVDETMQPESVGLWLKPTTTRPDQFDKLGGSESISQTGEPA